MLMITFKIFFSFFYFSSVKAKETKKPKKTSRSSSKKNTKEVTPLPKGRSSSSHRLTTDLFGEEEVVVNSKALNSVLWRRVAGGAVRRTEELEGDLFVEVRVYDTKEITGVDPRQRYWKAAVNLRAQIDSEGKDYDLLSTFLKAVNKKFSHEGAFFSDKQY